MAKMMNAIKRQSNTEKMIIYTKPNMSNLRGKVGKSIIDTIKNTKPSENTESRRIVEDYKKLILKMRTQSSESIHG